MKVTKFNKGEMYWYINPDVKKENYLKEGENQDFLDNRPVLIISNYIDEYNSSVIIIPTTTLLPVSMARDRSQVRSLMLPQKIFQCFMFWPATARSSWIPRYRRISKKETLKSKH